jgi:hypothetical protein
VDKSSSAKGMVLVGLWGFLLGLCGGNCDLLQELDLMWKDGWLLFSLQIYGVARGFRSTVGYLAFGFGVQSTHLCESHSKSL